MLSASMGSKLNILPRPTILEVLTLYNYCNRCVKTCYRVSWKHREVLDYRSWSPWSSSGSNIHVERARIKQVVSRRAAMTVFRVRQLPDFFVMTCTQCIQGMFINRFTAFSLWCWTSELIVGIKGNNVMQWSGSEFERHLNEWTFVSSDWRIFLTIFHQIPLLSLHS